MTRDDDLADAAALDMAEAYARALLGDRERAEALVDRTHDIVRDVDMALVVDWAQRVEAAARLALGDVDGARRLLRGPRRRGTRGEGSAGTPSATGVI